MLRDDAYELFRRAVVERDAHAWSQVAAGYRTLMIGWARRTGAAEISGKRDEDLADEALVRAWRALSAERFARFASEAAFLAYLQTCLARAAIDAGRAQAAEITSDWGARGGSAPELVAIERMSRADLWQILLRQAAGDAERLVLYDRFVLGLSPRAIHHRHPAVFPELGQVYELLRGISARLLPNHELQRGYGDHLAA